MLKSCFLKPLSVHIDVMRQLVPGIFITLGFSALKQYLASDKILQKTLYKLHKKGLKIIHESSHKANVLIG